MQPTQCVKQLVAAFGHAAGTEADVDLGRAIAGPMFHFLSRFCSSRLT
jgi:hypothetical protein